MQDLPVHLSRHDFKTLFVEVLGWDNASATHDVEVDGLKYRFQLIAHKRGFQVLVCEADRYTLFNRRLLRTLERRIIGLAHEHIIIYSSPEPRKQVWQWAVHMPDGRPIRHREHPFFSENPSSAMLDRLRGIRFSLGEEERVTLSDALDRVRWALDVESELNLFVNHPGYAEKGDKLALAMSNGGLAEMQSFVLFHRRLARWGTRRLVRWFGIDEEDAEQFGMLAIMAAATHFKPELGFQFSTYAVRAIHQRCARFGPPLGLLIPVPSPTYWPLSRLHEKSERLDARSGQGSSQRYYDWLGRRHPLLARRLRQYVRATEVVSLSDRAEPAFVQARSLADEQSNLDGGFWLSDRARVVRAALASLPEREAEIVQLRYGLFSSPEKLETIGQRFGLSKERVRQILLQAEATMLPIVLKMLGEEARPPQMQKTADLSEPIDEGNAAPESDLNGEIRALIEARTEVGAVELSKIVRVSRAERKTALRQLVEAGQIEQVGIGRNSRYRLPVVASPDPAPETAVPEVFVLKFDRPTLQGGLFAHAT